MLHAKYFKIISDFFLKRKFTSIFIFLLLIIINVFDLSIIFSIYQNIINIIKFQKFYHFELIFILIFSRILLSFVKKNIIKYNSLSQFCESLKRFFLFLQSSQEFGDKKNNFTKNILKVQMEINFSNFQANNFYYKIISYFCGSLIFFSILIFINLNFSQLSPISFFILIFTFISALSSIFFNYKSGVNEKRLNSKIENDLVNVNYEISEYSKKNNINSERDANFLKKIIDKQIETLKFKLKKNIFFYNFDYFSHAVQFIYFFCGFLFLNYFIQRNNNIDSFIIFYSILCLFFHINFVKLINLLLNKNSIYTILQANIMNHNSFNGKNLNNIDVRNINNFNKNESFMDDGKKEDSSKDLNQMNDIVLQDHELKNNFYFNSIELRNASITHPEFKNSFKNEEDFLYDLNLIIKEKTIIAFVTNDSSNIGLFRYLKFFNYKIKDGKMLVNSQDISNFSPEILKNSVQIISEANFDYNLNIRENIIKYNLTASDELIDQSCKITGIYEYIDSLPLVYHSTIAPGNLTDIQKFQISLSAAFLNDAQILILDFTRLINEDDAKITKIKSICIEALKDRIVIFLTNSTFGFKSLNNIVLFENNRIIANGTHYELMQNNQKYIKYFLKNEKLNILEEDL